MQGFVLNGVGKVAYYGDRAELQRIGRRWGQYSRREVRVFTGFRLNGVVRGGYYGNPADRFRCGGYRNGTRVLMYVHGGLGFRLALSPA